MDDPVLWSQLRNGLGYMTKGFSLHLYNKCHKRLSSFSSTFKYGKLQDAMAQSCGIHNFQIILNLLVMTAAMTHVY